MSTAQEIEAAIRSLPRGERERLVERLPKLLPELDGDAAWVKIIRDSRLRPGFTAMINEVQAEYGRNPDAFPKMEDSDFDRNE
jgi:hypothetical protein